MHMGEYLVAILDWLTKIKKHPLNIVECGTIRNPDFQNHEDGLSTYFIADWIKKSNVLHTFCSFELEHGNMVAAKKFLKENGGLEYYVDFGLGDAQLLLQHIGHPIDFCYLDAGADPDHNFLQFRRAEKWMRRPGFVVIDDVYDPRNANRGIVTVPYAQMEGYPTGRIAGRMAIIGFGITQQMMPLVPGVQAWRIEAPTHTAQDRFTEDA